MKLLVILLSFFFSHCPQDYHFLDKVENADLNYDGIAAIDALPGGKESMLKNVFNIKPGHYTVYRFMTSEMGEVPYAERLVEINKIIILKVKDGKIIDGYHFILQASEMPFTCRLYRITQKPKLKTVFPVKELKFKRVYKTNKQYPICTNVPMYLTEGEVVMN